MSEQGQESEAPMFQAANKHALSADYDLRKRDAVGKEEQEMLRKRKLQDMSMQKEMKKAEPLQCPGLPTCCQRSLISLYLPQNILSS